MNPNLHIEGIIYDVPVQIARRNLPLPLVVEGRQMSWLLRNMKQDSKCWQWFWLNTLRISKAGSIFVIPQCGKSVGCLPPIGSPAGNGLGGPV